MSKNTRKENGKRKGNNDKRKAAESRENEKRKNFENKNNEKRKEAATTKINNDVNANNAEPVKIVLDVEKQENCKRKDVENNEINIKHDDIEVAANAIDLATTTTTTTTTATSAVVATTMLTGMHPLNSKWTLWYYRPEKTKGWEDCQHQIHDIYTVEEFWSVFNHLRKPTEIQSGGDYSFFKNGIRPMWEDPQNREGGRLTVVHGSQKQAAVVDEVWLDLLILLIGENFDHADDVCGMVMNSRSYGYKIAVWTSHADEPIVRSIGQTIKRSLNPKSLSKDISFEVHSETQKNAMAYGKASSRSFFTI